MIISAATPLGRTRGAGYRASRAAVFNTSNRLHALSCAASKTTETVERYFRAVLNQHDLGVLEEIAAADVVFSDRVWSQRDAVGLKKLRKVHQQLLDSYPDYSVHVDSLLAREDSRVAMAHWTATGTCHEADADEDNCADEPSMRSVISGVSMFVVGEDGGRIREIIVYRQATELEKQQQQHKECLRGRRGARWQGTR